MIAYPLEDITCHAGIKEPDGKFHQLEKEIGYERDIDAGAEVKEDPSPYKINRLAAEDHHELGDKDEVYERQVLVIDPVINDTLGKEREYELEDAGDEDAGQQLDDESLMRSQEGEQEAEAGLFYFLACLVIEIRFGLEDEGKALILAFFSGAQPSFKELILRQPDAAEGGICDKYLVLFYFINDDEMILFPVDNERKGSIIYQLFEGDVDAHSAEPDGFGGVADAEK